MSVSLIEEVIEAHGGQYLWRRIAGLKIQLRVGGNVMEGWVEDVEVVWKQVAKSQPLR